MWATINVHACVHVHVFKMNVQSAWLKVEVYSKKKMPAESPLNSTVC